MRSSGVGEIVFVDLLDFIDGSGNHADAVLNHQPGELRAVNQQDGFIVAYGLIGSSFCGLTETGSGDEYPSGCAMWVKATGEIADFRLADLGGIPSFGLDVNLLEAQAVLSYDAVEVFCCNAG